MRFSSALLVLFLAVFVAPATAGSSGLKELGFDSKEIKTLEGLGVAAPEDLSILKEEDFNKLTGMSVVEVRRLEKKALAAGAVQRINVLDTQGITSEMSKFRLEPSVTLAGAKALIKRVWYSSRSPTKIEKMGKEDGATAALSRAVDMYYDDVDIVSNATLGLAHLATTEESKVMIGAFGGMDAVVHALMRHSNSSEVMVPAMELLAKISNNEKIRNVAGKEDAYQAILRSIPLHYEAKENYVETACLSLWQLTNPHQYCLHMASARGMADVVSALIKAGGIPLDVLLVKEEPSQNTPLHAAVTHNQKDVVALILNATQEPAALITQREKIGWTPLHIAAALGNKEIMELMVKAGGKEMLVVRDQAEKAIPLHTAAQRGKMDVVKYLLSEEPELIHAKDDALNTVLHLAAANGQRDMVEYLIKNHMNDDFKQKNEIGYLVTDLSDLNKHYGITELIETIMPKDK